MTFDKFLNRSIKILLSCVMVVFITIITLFLVPNFSLPVFAYAPIPVYSGSGSPSGQYIVDNGFLVYSRSINSSRDESLYFIAGTDDIRIGWVENSGLVLYSPNPANGWQYYFYSSGDQTSVSTFNLTSQRNGFYWGYLLSSGYKDYISSDIPVYSSLDELFSSDSTVSISSFNRTITIKPGYVAYVQTDGGTLDLVAQFHVYSRFSRPLWDNGVRISFNGGLVPTSGTVFNDSFGSSVDWLKVASAPSNLLGQTMTGGRSYTAGLPEAGSNKCVVIYNPAYGNANTLVGGGTVDLGVYISATFSNVIDVTQYKLRADATVTYTSGAAISSGSPDDYNLAYSYIPSDNDPSDVVTDSDYRLLDLSDNTSGPAIDMNAGGYNGTSDYENDNSEEAENGILGLLTRIFKFLSAPVSHIMSLFNAGGNFMAWLGQLWVWLPSDVGAILVDALIVLIVIGAIKFLWK